MYFKSIEIEHVGPIDRIKIDFEIANGAPKPIVLVGENGSGKSILLSHLANALLVGKQEVYEDTEVENGKVYKYRSPHYIQSGQDYFFASVTFDTGIEIAECQLKMSKETFEQMLKYLPARSSIKNCPADQSSVFVSTFNEHKKETDEFYKQECCLYFPVNRFEEPAWLNVDNLRLQAEYSELKHLNGISNRQIICVSPLKANKNWILDILLDRQLYDIKFQTTTIPNLQGTPPSEINEFLGFSGSSTTIHSAINQVLKTILRDQGDIRLGASTRANRQISVMRNDDVWIPNLFQLSTGEVLLLNLFLSIVRDFDLTGKQIDSISDVSGIVLVDEIDAHLHTIYQKEVLPNLIALFPKVQFIMTSHSPLFLIGMEEKFGRDGFDIYDLPTGSKVVASDFSEFQSAYDAFKATNKHRNELSLFLQAHSKPVFFVEGQIDIDYIQKALELSGKSDLLSKIELQDGSGFGNLNAIWKSLETPLAKIVKQKIVLIYDCDTNKANKSNGNIHSRTIPIQPNNPIKKGIENLLSEATILKIESSNPKFIDKVEPTLTRTRGVNQTTSATYSINPDEKRNLCDWLITNGSKDEFDGLNAVIAIIEEFV